MATFTVTIPVGLNLFGGSPATRWGTSSGVTMIWGQSHWGEGDRSIDKVVGKVLFETVIPTDAISSKQTTKYIYETMVVSADMVQESLYDGAGYLYRFPDRVTDAEDRSFASWTVRAQTTASWTTRTVTTSSWSTT